MTKLCILNGPDIGLSFQLRDGATYVGRSIVNDIQIEDQTVSRRHLKTIKRGNRFFIADQKSQNGTFFNGRIIAPGLEIQVNEEQPIAIGMTVICLGQECMEQMISLVDSIGLNRATGERSGIFMAHGDKNNQKKLELPYKVSEVLDENMPTNEGLGRILHYVFDLLKRIDRAAFILVDPETETILDVISKSSERAGESTLPIARRLSGES